MADIFNAIQNLFESIIKVYGPTYTLLILSGIVLILSLRRYYKDKRKDKEANLVIEEKEKTIQRLAQENREWRILFFKENFNWDEEQIDRFIQKAQHKSPKEAREALEGDKK